ncbi:hypothetical protein EYR40_003242 [Pleurotus pulmonarius]|nr:hypothetical protein EYR40_003242 [Pleurotus pulmonarius]
MLGQHRVSFTEDASPDPFVESLRPCTSHLESLPVVHDGDPVIGTEVEDGEWVNETPILSFYHSGFQQQMPSCPAYLVGLLRCRDEIRRRAINIRPIDLEAKFKEHGLTCDAEAGELEAIPDEKIASKKWIVKVIAIKDLSLFQGLGLLYLAVASPIERKGNNPAMYGLQDILRMVVSIVQGVRLLIANIWEPCLTLSLLILLSPDILDGPLR